MKGCISICILNYIMILNLKYWLHFRKQSLLKKTKNIKNTKGIQLNSQIEDPTDNESDNQ